MVPFSIAGTGTLFTCQKHVLADCLKFGEEKSIVNRINKAIKIHEEIKEKIKRELYFDVGRVAGYYLRTEGLDPLIRHGIEVKPNQAKFGSYGNCPCGSGKPYDDCCKVLENY